MSVNLSNFIFISLFIIIKGNINDPLLMRNILLAHILHLYSLCDLSNPLCSFTSLAIRNGVQLVFSIVLCLILVLLRCPSSSFKMCSFSSQNPILITHMFFHLLHIEYYHLISIVNLVRSIRNGLSP